MKCDSRSTKTNSKHENTFVRQREVCAVQLTLIAYSTSEAGAELLSSEELEEDEDEDEDEEEEEDFFCFFAAGLGEEAARFCCSLGW